MKDSVKDKQEKKTFINTNEITPESCIFFHEESHKLAGEFDKMSVTDKEGEADRRLGKKIEEDKTSTNFNTDRITKLRDIFEKNSNSKPKPNGVT